MEYLKIENFKCFYEVDIPINGLTIFAGANGNGKSTAIQSLLFLRRTIEHCAIWENNMYNFKKPNGLNVELNGSYCLSLGNSSFVLPKDSSKNEAISLGLFNEDEEFNVTYEIGDDNLGLTPTSVINEINKLDSLFKQEIYYLNAERIGPRIKQEIRFFDYPTTGYQGEFVAQLIGDTDFNYKFKVEDERINIKLKNPRLEQQVNAWLDYIMPGVSVYATCDKETLSAQVKINNTYTKGEHIIAPNIGFGISYILPIIVTGLIAKKKSFMIVENPEAHLHPSAQSKIGRFLAMVAKSGVKVIVETHSDHFINGIQIACSLNEIDSDIVTINHFSYDENSIQPNIDSLSINKKGELSNWPKGFFDQTQIDFAELFDIRKYE
ncbi:putative ATPase [Flavobacterium sp. 1]|uniref:AAA family ATPase n=1 Tax=Flavobacterium sp. 1 TaxID=2035200 RepID=UPI000C236D03|nr:DUF3696 domain-containing protein [Flavobacterium sp. 1]PJJ06890.1 putative ATPase [Flavobacterium sp. 1]